MRSIGISAVAGAISLVIACRQPTAVSVHTPLAESPEAHLLLAATTAHFASGSDGRVRLLARFPLPGAHRGQPFCSLYFRLPAGLGVFPVGEGPAAADGFLIQHFGSLAGWLKLNEGYVSLEGVPFGGSGNRQGRIAVKASDGTIIEGSFSAIRGARVLDRFEREFAPDVARLDIDNTDRLLRTTHVDQP